LNKIADVMVFIENSSFVYGGYMHVLNCERKLILYISSLSNFPSIKASLSNISHVTCILLLCISWQ